MQEWLTGTRVHAVCPDKKAGESVATAIHDFQFIPPCQLRPLSGFAGAGAHSYRYRPIRSLDADWVLAGEQTPRRDTFAVPSQRMGMAQAVR